jgi:FecR protein
MNRRCSSALGLSFSFLVAGMVPAVGQPVIGAKSGVINWVEGDVFLADKPYTMQPSQFGEVKENMVFRTEEGRAEILLPPGVFFRLGEKSSFKMITNRLIDTRVELLAGSAVLEIADLSKEATVTVVCKDGTISLNKIGIYRIDADPAQVKVFKGTADVALHGETVSVPTGKMLLLSGAVASAEKFNSADTDSLDHWSRRRGEMLANANISAAKQANGAYGSGSSDPCFGSGGYRTGPFARPWGTWGYNPYYGFGTYIPCQGTLMSPYGYRYWSPIAVYRAFYAPRPTYNPGVGMGGGGFGVPSYSSYGGTSGGYSGSVGHSTGGFSGASTAAAASSAGSTASSAGSSSAGHGGGGGGGHGK